MNPLEFKQLLIMLSDIAEEVFSTSQACDFTEAPETFDFSDYSDLWGDR